MVAMTRGEFEYLLSEIHFFYTPDAMERTNAALAEYDRLTAENAELKELLNTVNELDMDEDFNLIKKLQKENAELKGLLNTVNVYADTLQQQVQLVSNAYSKTPSEDGA